MLLPGGEPSGRSGSHGGTGPDDRLIQHRCLIALCVGANLVEAIALAGLGAQAGLNLAPQASAPVPFGIFHDLRWLIVYSNSWISLALESAALLAIRSLLTALTVRAAWPRGLATPPLRSLLLRAGGFTVAGAGLLAPCALLLFGLAVAPISWFFLAAVPTALVVALLFHHGAIAPGWWRQTLAPRAVAWLVLSFAVLSLSAEAISASDPVPAVMAAGLAGLFNAWAWHGLVHAVTGRARCAPFRPVAPAGLMGFGAIAVGGALLGFTLVAPTLPPALAAPARRSLNPPGPAVLGAGPTPGALNGANADRPVLVVAGYGTHWDGRTKPGLQGPYLEQRFSYRGLGPTGSPMAYAGVDTTQPLVQMERLLSAQVDTLHRTSGLPVSIVADSEGSLVAKAYLAATPGAPVDNLVMVSPLVRPARVYFPPAGDLGWGLVGGLGLQVMGNALQSFAPVSLSATSPFLRSVVQEGPDLRSLLSCPLPGIRQLALLPLADAVASPDPAPIGVPTIVVPAFHGGMLSNPTAERAIRAMLKGGSPDATPGWSLADLLIRSAASAWQVPELALPLFPVQGSRGEGSASPGPATCGGIQAQLESQLKRAQ